jgi:hypothetical protein
LQAPCKSFPRGWSGRVRYLRFNLIGVVASCFEDVLYEINGAGQAIFLEELKGLTILNAGATDAGLKELREALPNCETIR